jgi:F0F1-type ATP synthase membrane subunit b/b'
VIKLPPDITFVIQLVGFVVFWQLMRTIIFVPMQRALEARAARIGGVRTRVEALIAEAAQLGAPIEAGLADAKRDGAQRAEEIRRRAEAEDQAILARYRGEAATLLERARATTESQVSSARAPLESEAARLAESVVRRVLGRAA